MDIRAGTAFAVALGAVLVYVVSTSVTGNRFFPAAVFASAAAYALFWGFGKFALRWTFPMSPLAGMALWAFLPGSRAAPLWAAYFVLALLATQILEPPRVRMRLRRFAILFSAVFAAIALAQRVAMNAGPDHPFVTIANRNHFAAFIELLLPLAWWEFLKSRRPVYALAAGVVFLSVVISASRTGILLTSGELLILAVIGMRRFRRLSWKMLIPAAAILVVLAGGLGTTAWERFSGLSYDAANSTRGLTARASLAMLRERPLSGFGLGTWASVYPRFAETDTGFDLIHADDDWLEWAAEGGLPFVGFVLLLAGIAVKNVSREPWSIGLPAVLIHSFTEFPLQKPAVMSWFVVLLAMSAIARRQHRS